MAGELARIEGKRDEATSAYKEAIGAARESGATQWVGLASELAAKFWSTRKAPIVTRVFASEARAAYLQWGARGKVQHLNVRWPHLEATLRADSSSTSSTESTQIDALTVVKTQQVISGEIVLERLVTTLLRAAIENAGAQRGALPLPGGMRSRLWPLPALCRAPRRLAREGLGAGAAMDDPHLCPAYA